MLFFFATSDRPACAPALVKVEEEKAKSPKRPESPPRGGDYDNTRYGL